MQNITKLKIWPQLAALGFEPIKFKHSGVTVAVGAALRRKGKGLSGQEFYCDLICIEPHSYSNKRNYHIKGEIKTPYYVSQKYYTEQSHRPKELHYLKDHVNQFYRATEILPVIEMMLK